ncbi:MAG: DUF2975 domain-containing protein [Lachnospiraceae bacterium]|nr:DUF2975 domain-containing protein [Clostridiales bacterium]MBR6851246.1 DUF2975 domain-containing protein [Lachnospiraceae bacterium]
MQRQSEKPTYNLWLNLTLLACAVFCICVLLGDLFGYSFCRYCWEDHAFSGNYVHIFSFLDNSECRFSIFLTCFYLSTAITYPILYCVVRLLLNLKKNIVFDKKNTTYMNAISLLCLLIALICFVSASACATLALISLVGVFVGLIVQCVRLVMDKAIDMRAELDLTV